MNAIQIELKGRESNNIPLFDVVNYLFDFNVAYEIGRLATDPNHANFQFSHFVLFRKGRPLLPEERLQLVTLHHGSPTKLVANITATAAAVGAIWALVQIFTKIHDHPVEHRKLIAEARKAELEVAKLERELGTNTAGPLYYEPYIGKDATELAPELVGFEQHLEERGAAKYLNQVTNRLAASPVKIEDVEVRVVQDK